MAHLIKIKQTKINKVVMFEAKLLDGSILKRIVEAIKDVVNDVNIDVSPSGKHLLHQKMLFLVFVSTI